MRAVIALALSTSACHLIGGAGDYVIGEGGSGGIGGTTPVGGGGSAGDGGTATGGGGTGGMECTPGVDCPTEWLVTLGNGVEHIAVNDAAAAGDVAIVGRFKSPVIFDPASSVEVPSSGAHFDGFTAVYDANGHFRWLRGVGDMTNDQETLAVAMDANGDVVAVGSFKGNVDFGGGRMGTTGSKRAYFVVRYAAASGATEWLQTIGNPAHEDLDVEDVAIEQDGDVVVVGRFKGDVDFGGMMMTGSHAPAKYDAFIARYSSEGTFLDVQPIGNGSDDSVATAVAVGPSGVVVAGRFRGDVDFGGALASSHTAMKSDVFVASFQAPADCAWVEAYGNGADDQHAEGVAVDASGRITVGGRFKGQVDFDGGSLVPTADKYDGFLLVQDAAGGYLWSRTFGDGLADQHVLAVDVDDADNIIAVGRFAGIVDFGATTLGGPPTYSGFVARYSASESPLSAQAFAGEMMAEASASGVAASSGGVLVAGRFRGAVDFGSGSTVPSHMPDRDDGFLLQLVP